MVQTESVGVLGADMSPSWQKFLQTKVNSFIKWDLVRFFHDNPHTAETAENIAHFVGRDVRTIQRELDELVSNAVLVVERVTQASIYRLSDDAETRTTISEFMSACLNRDFRMQAIHHVINNMGFNPPHDQ